MQFAATSIAEMTRSHATNKEFLPAQIKYIRRRFATRHLGTRHHRPGIDRPSFSWTPIHRPAATHALPPLGDEIRSGLTKGLVSFGDIDEV